MSKPDATFTAVTSADFARSQDWAKTPQARNKVQADIRQRIASAAIATTPVDPAKRDAFRKGIARRLPSYNAGGYLHLLKPKK